MLDTLRGALCAPGCSVRCLYLSQVDCTSAVAESLAHLLRSDAPLSCLALVRVDFGGEPPWPSPVFTEICDALADAPSLTQLALNDCQLIEEDMPALALLLQAHRTLRSFELSDSLFSGAGVAILAQALSHPCATLQSLALYNVFEAGQHDIQGAAALAAMIRTNKSLRELHVVHDNGDGRGEEFDAAELGMFDEDDTIWGAAAARELFDALAANTTLRRVTLPYMYPRGDAHLKFMQDLQLKSVRGKRPFGADVVFSA